MSRRKRCIRFFLGVLPSWRIKFLVNDIFDRIVGYIRPWITFREYMNLQSSVIHAISWLNNILTRGHVFKFSNPHECILHDISHLIRWTLNPRCMSHWCLWISDITISKRRGGHVNTWQPCHVGTQTKMAFFLVIKWMDGHRPHPLD